jgi:D-alanyl-D-alanine carboxypeptidase (penicillin-binding protein 5/6)
VSQFSVLQGGRSRRRAGLTRRSRGPARRWRGGSRRRGRPLRGQARRHPSRHLALAALLTLALGALVLLAFMDALATGPALSTRQRAARPAIHHAAPHPVYGLVPAAPAQQVHLKRLKAGLRSGILFDLRTGRVLWQRGAGTIAPIASLTKMMTALIVAGRAKPSDRVMITSAATHFSGSGVGLLPLGKRVPLIDLLYGLLLPSGNDAAIALAQHVAGSQPRFIDLMNQEATDMALTCTHFSTVSGVVDQGNYSCPRDLAVLAHAVLGQPLLRRIVGTRSEVLPFPIKGGKLYLYNNNPLLLSRFPGADGVKTGYTQAAGQCLVAAARRGRAWLGVVLLHSGNPGGQAQQLLNAGFAKLSSR